LNSRRRNYRFGDVVFVSRTVFVRGRFVLYHHAGIVILVDDNGQALEIMDFDPTFDRPNQEMDLKLIRRALTGMRGIPRILEGEALRATFPEEHTHVEEAGPTEAEEIRAVRERIEAARGQSRVYLLLRDNCQHFAMFLRTGKGSSPDVDSLAQALRDGVSQGVAATQRLVVEPLSEALRDLPFNGDRFLGAVGNGLVAIIIILLMILLAILVFLVATATTTSISYFEATRSRSNTKADKKK